jgi:hypothetical protein
MFCDFYLVKNFKIDTNSTTPESTEKICTNLESLEFYKFLDVGLDKFKNNDILPNKISHIFLVTTKLFTG